MQRIKHILAALLISPMLFSGSVMALEAKANEGEYTTNIGAVPILTEAEIKLLCEHFGHENC